MEMTCEERTCSLNKLQIGAVLQIVSHGELCEATVDVYLEDA